MERQFFINWSAIVEEAKQRRKAARLTQARLATMAGVSTPTISRFENGEKDIQLSTVISVLTVLGMNDQRTLTFSLQNSYYDTSRKVVIFTGKDKDKIISCAISKEALGDHFGDNEDPLKTFQEHHSIIEHKARQKYLADKLQIDGSILLKTQDI